MDDSQVKVGFRVRAGGLGHSTCRARFRQAGKFAVNRKNEVDILKFRGKIHIMNRQVRKQEMDSNTRDESRKPGLEAGARSRLGE